MPTYTFMNTESGVEYDENVPLAEYDNYMKKNPSLERVWHGHAPAVTGDHIMGVGPKTDAGFEDRMSQIANAHPGSPLASRYKSNESHAKIRARAVIEKHKKRKPLVS